MTNMGAVIKRKNKDEDDKLREKKTLNIFILGFFVSYSLEFLTKLERSPPSHAKRRWWDKFR